MKHEDAQVSPAVAGPVEPTVRQHWRRHMKFDYCAMHSGAVIGDQDLRCRVIRHDDGRAATQREVWGALCNAREALALHEVGSAYAHRLAVMLECALLDQNGTWNDAHALLDEYRAACRAAAPKRTDTEDLTHG